MAKAKNKVISGDYLGYSVDSFLGQVTLSSVSNSITLNKSSVANIELVDSSKQRDTGSTIARGLVGGILLGPAGIVGGALLGKSNGVHLLSVIFKNGKRSLIEVEDKVYKEILKKLY